jgi:hypothetical protein
VNQPACLTGCRTAPDDDGNRHPVRTEHPSLLCHRCEDRLQTWLERIPEAYADLPMFVQPGSVDANPESQATKRAHPPVPLRLEVVDLLDQRLGRRWLGTQPAEDRHGAVGVLETWARLVREERNIDPAGPATVVGEAAFLLRHRLWIVEQPWVDEFYDDIKTLHRAISDAVGDYRPRPVGRCHVPDGQSDCGGPLMPSPWGGVRCGRCGSTWDAGHLRQLGLAQAAPEPA